MSEQLPPSAPVAPSRKRGTPAKVMIPAILLVIVGAINLIYGIQATIRNALRFNDPLPVVEADDDPPERNTQLAENLDKLIQPFDDFNEAIGPYAREFNLGVSLALLVIGVLITVGGVQMCRLKSYKLAMTAAILSCVPCVTLMACCGLGEVAGIYSCIVLMGKDVKALFT